jgi:hypothetical protein
MQSTYDFESWDHLQDFSLNLRLSPLFQNSKCIIFGRIGKKGKITETTIKQIPDTWLAM